ncbi:VWA domain-containing protein [Yoonia sp. I 8.24]|uniref:vWA domain-containing protein n=1 Tax=Yoonia sp. I 8.24 TaxID=1537229 RepID=UPI001EDE3351|nr:VWA domain-containing protein [Yoonia sp. I 8.24]
MTDDLDDLKSMMDVATPRADAARRAENLALAQKNFDDLQGSRAQPRPTPVTGRNRLWTGVKNMLNSLTSKAALTTTTAIVACGFLVLTPAGQDLLNPNNRDFYPTPIPAPEPENSAAQSDDNIPINEIEQIDTPRADASARDLTDNVAEPMSEEPALTADLDMGSSVDVAAVHDGLKEHWEALDTEQLGTLDVGGLVAAGDMSPEPIEQSDAAGSPEILRGDFNATLDDMTMAAPEAPVMAEALSRAAPARSGVSFSGTATLGYSGPDEASTPNTDRHALLLNTETYANAATNPLKITSDDPVSSFSIDVDTASYSVVRSSLSRGHLPPADAVRIEEMVNYFPYAYPAPEDDSPFRTTVSSFETPWNPDTQLVHIALQGQMPALDDRPPLNLVFLIDTSGSMNQPEKLPLLKQSFRIMLDQLRPEDQIAIVEYAGSAGQVLAPTAAFDRATILEALQSLGAGGSTNGQGGLEQAYAVADTMAEDGEVSRVILATDGDFNVGINNPDALKDFIADKRDTGTYLSVLGFGRGNLDDATMQALAQNGNGTAAFIDTLSEAQKVLVDQLSGALFPIAGDVKVQVEFNPAQVAEYRLIGYETRALNREDFNNDRVDAGELGAGHTVTAIYEITPVGSPAQLSDPLRYAPNTVAETSDELGFVKLRYKAPGEDTSQLIETAITGTSIPGTEANFAAAIAGFGQLLRDDTYLGDWGYSDAIALANANRGDDDFGYRTEAVQLMRLAQSLSE